MTARRHEVIFGTAMILVLVLGVLLEMAFRAIRAGEPGPDVDWAAMVDAIGETDPATERARFVPGASYGQMQFNSLGLRGPEAPLPQPPDLVRIALLGDSKVMSANYPEAESLSGRVVADLARLVPHCRFDYVTMAGPGYTVPFLAALWTEVAPQTDPDMAVVLAGTVGEMTAGLWPTGRGPSGRQTWLDRLLAQSWLVGAAQRHLYAISSRLAPPPEPVFDEAALVQRHSANFAPLVAALGATPVLALGYRGRLREGLSAEDQARFAQDLQLDLRGLTVAEAISLTELNVAEVARIAAEAGWWFGDPIAGLATEDDRFLDNHHFSALGLEDLGARVAALIAPLVQADCTIASELSGG